MRRVFSPTEKQKVAEAGRRAADLVSRFYVLARREWAAMPFEVRTLEQLEPAEIDDSAYAQVRCYGVRRTVEGRVVAEHDLYRICLHDERILDHARRTDESAIEPFLLYVLTHELVHVVRFGQRMQTIDMPTALRPLEEASVDRTARLILRDCGEPAIAATLDRFPTPDA